MEKHVTSVEDDFKFQKAEWPVYRIGWVLMGSFLLLGLFGLFGTGRMAKQKAESQNLSVNYDRYLRYSMAREISIKLKKPLLDSSIYLNRSYIQKIKLDKISPEPESMEPVGNQIRLKFASPVTKEIIFYIEPIDSGSHQLMLEANGEKHQLKQYIYF